MQLSLSIHPGELFVEVVSKNILQLWYVLGIVKWNQIYFRKLVDREVYPVFVTKIGILQFWCCQLFMLYRRDLQFSVKKYLTCSCSVLFKIFKLFIYLLIFLCYGMKIDTLVYLPFICFININLGWHNSLECTCIKNDARYGHARYVTYGSDFIFRVIGGSISATIHDGAWSSVSQ